MGDRERQKRALIENLVLLRDTEGQGETPGCGQIAVKNLELLRRILEPEAAEGFEEVVGKPARCLPPIRTREDALSYGIALLTLPSTPLSDGDGHVRVRPNRTRNYPFSSLVRRGYHSSSGAVSPDAISCALAL